MKKRCNIKFGLFVLLLMLSVGSWGKVVLHSIWGSNMVLQQQSEVTFYGKANPGKTLSIVPSWSNKKIVTSIGKNGTFSIKVSTPKAGGPYSIIFSDGETLILKNILIGEVWFCSGQSNMEMPVKGFRGQPVFGNLPYIAQANSKRQLRLFTVKNAWSTTPRTDGIDGHWTELSSKEVANFSAVGYFFGDMLQTALDVPVGLINCSWSMSKIEAWMDKETLKSFSEVQLPDVNQKQFDWTAGTPTLLWNAMVNPWKGFPIKGVIWYQGEANSPYPALYKKLFPAMASQWREFFKSPHLPFYYVQLAPWQSEGSDKLDWAEFRQVQLDLMKEVPDVGMVTTGDAGSEIFIHTPYKIKIGQRLAYWALAKTYGHEGFQCSGPIINSYKLNGSVVELNFDYGEDGLNPENQQLAGFEIAGKDSVFVSAKAEIIPSTSTVKVWNDSIVDPIEVRYCFRNYKIGDFFNNAGLPASPFRIVINHSK